MKVDDLVRNYRQFLINSWPVVEVIMNKIDWDNDQEHLDFWMQDNWHHLVEKLVINEENEHIQGYGGGPPFYDNDEERVTHLIVCNLEGTLYPFRYFANKKGLFPPFDQVALWDFKKHNVKKVKCDEVHFTIVERDYFQ